MSNTGHQYSEDPSLAALMRAAQDGDKQAYRELLETITPVVRRMVCRKRGFLQTPDIEDLVQDVLVSLHSARATYDPRRPFLPWVSAIARSRLADGGRRYARRSANEVMVENLPETFSGASTNTDMEPYGDRQALMLAISQLPAGQKRAVELLKLREATLEEAAGLTGMSVGALKVAVHRGIRALRVILTSEGEIGNQSPSSTAIRRR